MVYTQIHYRCFTSVELCVVVTCIHTGVDLYQCWYRFWIFHRFVVLKLLLTVNEC